MQTQRQQRERKPGGVAKEKIKVKIKALQANYSKLLKAPSERSFELTMGHSFAALALNMVMDMLVANMRSVLST